MSKTLVIIGSGVAGLAAAIRMQLKGYKVLVLEKNDFVGGKLHSIELDEFRFDAGPSLFTLPHLVDELFELARKPNPFKYQKLDQVCNYFFADGTKFIAPGNTQEFINQFSQTFNEDPARVAQFIKTIKYNYQLTSPIFLQRSLHKLGTYLRLQTLWGMLNLWRLRMFTPMSKVLTQTFSNANAAQFFMRYATYNGSNPYQAPATLCVIPHIEIGMGAYFPHGGMQSISHALYTLAAELGVQFKFNTEVKAINTSNKNVTGVTLQNGEKIDAGIVISNADAKFTYNNMLNTNLPAKILKAENSSSALIFYWGINRQFQQLDLHNIVFTANYKQEFNALFNHKTIGPDPTIYINITSKLNSSDAPTGSENWFVLINAPAHYDQNWDQLIQQTRATVIDKLSKTLNCDLQQHIQQESILSPPLIEKITGSNRGSLYGSSSNSKMSAFLRQSNFSSTYKGLYFCGGSVHPGGGIPLCLYSASIVSNLISHA